MENEIPLVRIYMEVDLQNCELPTGRWGYTVRELADACGVSLNLIYSNMSHCRKRHIRCRYVRVEIEDDFPLIITKHGKSRRQRSIKTA